MPIKARRGTSQNQEEEDIYAHFGGVNLIALTHIHPVRDCSHRD